MAKKLSDKRQKALLDQIKESRSQFEALQDEVDDAKKQYYDAVRALHESGMPLREIADHVGLSHQRVHQMLNDGAKPPKRMGRGLGAAGILLAIVLAGLALVMAQIDPEHSPPEVRRIRLANDTPITRNDVRLLHKFERPIASGSRAGKRWEYLVSYLQGKYCVRFRWEPGPFRQGESCSQIRPGPEQLTDGRDIGFSVNPGTPNDPISRIGVVHGQFPSFVAREISVELCDGRHVDAKLIPVRGIGMTFWYTFLPTGSSVGSVSVKTYDGPIVRTPTHNTCAALTAPRREKPEDGWIQ